jgi:uncharacterized protein
MALRGRSDWRRPFIALATGAGIAASCLPAAAQYWGDRYPGYDSRYYQPGPSRDYYGFPFDGGFMRPPPPPVVDSTKAPPPRKLETPPGTNVVVIGDSMADWLAYGLDETYTDQPDIGFERKIRATAGLIRYDPKSETLDWPQVAKDSVANEKVSAIIVMLGLNDRVSLRDQAPPKPEPRKGEPAPQAASQPAAQTPQDKAAAPSDGEAPPAKAAAGDTQHPAPGGSYDFHTDQWAALYGKRIDEMISALKSKGVPVIWVGLPAIRGTKSTSDVNYLDELYRERAEKAGVVYVDIWDGFVDDQGRYAVQGPDFEGQTRRLRAGDGVHFTKAGAVKLASYVDRELRRALSSHIAPVALPGPEAAPKSPTGVRPDVGPVLPLAVSGGDAGNLLGADPHPAQMTPDPIAAKVLSRGDPIAPPAGRADDFSWPRPANDAGAASDIAPEPVSLTPAVAPKKGAAGKNDAKKVSDAKSDAKSKSAADPGAAKTRRSPDASLDGAPRPPKDVGGGF